MDNIQLATTLVAPTGTGFLFVPYSSDANSAVFKEDTYGPLLAFRRTLPKPTNTTQGVERLEVKYTEKVTVGDVIHSCIFTLTAAIPVPVGVSARTNLFTRVALIARDPAVKAGFEYGRIPL